MKSDSGFSLAMASQPFSFYCSLFNLHFVISSFLIQFSFCLVIVSDPICGDEKCIFPLPDRIDPSGHYKGHCDISGRILLPFCFLHNNTSLGINPSCQHENSSDLYIYLILYFTIKLWNVRLSICETHS